MIPTTDSTNSSIPALGPVAFRTGCSVLGCERSHRCRGLCRRHYTQARRCIKRADPVWTDRQRTHHADYIRRRSEADPEWAERRRVARRESTARCKARRQAERGGGS
jgi:hypothetical protein